MKSLYGMLLVLTLMAAGCGPAMRGSGNIISESREVKDFSKIAMSGSGKLVIEQRDIESLTITTDDNLISELTSEVDHGTLRLGTKDFIIDPTKTITYTLLVKNLNSINLSGGSQVEAKGLRTDSLDINVSGAGDITISGETDKQTISISGAGKYRADGFKSKRAEVQISGIGSAIVAVSESLDVNVSGAGEVEYVGDPKVTQQVSGAGTIRRRS